MGATNKTAHYDLPQFIGTDKPGWLTDVNGAMQQIDEGIYQAAVAAQGAQTSADAATGAVQTVNADLSDTKTTLAATTTTAQTALTNTQQQAGQIAQNSTNVSTINARLGNTDISGIGGGTVTGAIRSISEQAGAQIDNDVTQTSANAVKSSGIYGFVQGITAGLTFAQDASGAWGYKIGGADPVIPFKSIDPASYVKGSLASIPTGGRNVRFTGLKPGAVVILELFGPWGSSPTTYQAISNMVGGASYETSFIQTGSAGSAGAMGVRNILVTASASEVSFDVGSTFGELSLNYFAPSAPVTA